MASDFDSSSSPLKEADPGTSGEVKATQRGWLKMGAVAVVSAMASGLAAAWFYRKTLAQLRPAEGNGNDSEIKTSASDFEEDL